MNLKLKNNLAQYLHYRYSLATAQSYLYSIERFIDKYPHANKLGLKGIERYLAELKKQGQTVSYRSVTLSAIKVYYNFAIENCNLQRHPCKSLFLSEKKPTGKNFNGLLSILELESIFTVLPSRYNCTKYRNKAILGILIYQGITSGELTSLKIDHIDFDAGTITIPSSVKRMGRTLALKSSQVVALIKYIELERPKLAETNSKPLFVSMRGMKMTVDGLHSIIHSMSGAYDKELSPKNIRQSVICHWLNGKKIPLEDVQIMAGHRYPSSTEKYIQQDVQGQREAVTALHENIFM